MPGRADRELDVGAAFHMNCLFPSLERLRSVGAEIFRRVGRIDGFDEEVLNVRIRGRQSPGDRIVLAEHEDRGAGQSGALD